MKVGLLAGCVFKLVYLFMHWFSQTVLLTSMPAVKHASVESIPLVWMLASMVLEVSQKSVGTSMRQTSVAPFMLH